MSKSKNRKQESSGSGMKRNIGIFSVFSIATGAMFSSGFFLLPGIAAAETGPSMPLVYLVAGLCMIPAIWSIGELASAIPRSGGPYIFLTRSFGPLIGMIGALGKYLQLLLKGAFAFVGVGAYLSLVADISITPLAIGLIIFFTVLNLIGVKQTATTEKIMVVVLLLLLTYFVVSGMTEVISLENNWQERITPIFPAGISGFIAAVSVISVSYGGFGQVASVAEEVKNPSYSIPKGMLIALGISTIFYCLGTGVMILLVEPGNLRDVTTPVAITAEKFTILHLPVLLIVIAALAAFASTGNAAILSAARYPLAMARDRLVWSGFSNLDKKGIPKLSVMFTGFILVVLVSAFEVERIAKFASAFLLFAFMGLSAAVIIFRESKIREYKPGYKSPLYPWIQILGILIYAGLIIESGLESIIFIVSVCLIGIIWYYVKVKKQVNASGAIYNLFGRLSRNIPQQSGEDSIGIPRIHGSDLSGLVQRAIVLNNVKDEGLDKVSEHAARALKDILGGEFKKLNKLIRAEAKPWSSPLQEDISVAPILLDGIEQPEMIIMKGKITVEQQKLGGFIVLVDDKNQSERLINYLSVLSTIIRQPEFEERWHSASKPEELKQALMNDIRLINIVVGENEKVGTLENKHLRDLELPKGCRIFMVENKGRLFIPEQDTKLEKGDRLSLIAETEARKQLEKELGVK